jgi:hypothetical protein
MVEEFETVSFCYCKHEMLRAEMEHLITEAVQSNPWVKVFGCDFQDDPMMEVEYDYEYTWVSCIGELKAIMEHGNWAIRTAFVLGDLCFMQQVNGGDEWLTLKFFKEHGWVSFESISFELVIRDGEFEDLIARLITASYEDCKGLNY